MREVLRTPDKRFDRLPGFPYPPNYIEDLRGYEGMRMHYVDEGPTDASHVFLCLHGEPTWSYLYRKMIPVFTAAGYRAVAPDFFGFGRSDKPADDSIYQFDFHRDFLVAFIKRLDLQRMVLVCQDWGGILGLTLPMDMPDRFSHLIVMNTVLATGKTALPSGFLAWRQFVANNPGFNVTGLMKRACPQLSDAECSAYGAPFPGIRYKAGVRRFPAMLPDRPDAPGAALSRKARDWFQSRWSGESFMAIGMQDPVLGPPVMRTLHRVIKGCPPPHEMVDAGHFVQESGDEVAKKALEAFGL